MKPSFHLLGLLAAFLGGILPTPAPAAPPPTRVGTYDSRLIAFAAFWSDECQSRLSALKGEARAAKARGDTARYEVIVREITNGQAALHLQVFSTAPIDDVLAGLQDRLPAIRKELNVARLVSQWDAAALAAVPAADRVDVTKRLLDEYPSLPAAQRRQLEQVQTSVPIPLWRARLMRALHLF